jgi:hypothetical protein
LITPAATNVEDSILVFESLSWSTNAEQFGKLAPLAAFKLGTEVF